MSRIVRDDRGIWSEGDPEAAYRDHREQSRPSAFAYAAEVALITALATEVGAVGGKYDDAYAQLNANLDQLHQLDQSAHPEPAKEKPAASREDLARPYAGIDVDDLHDHQREFDQRSSALSMMMRDQ